jgi:hypothetical protein
MAYRIAGIDVHKKKLAVVVADVEVHDEYQFERRWFGSNPEQLQGLAEWLIEQRVEEVVMESTAQYWKPLWSALERYWKPSCQNREGAGKMSGTLHLAQALSNRGRRGRKKDFPDAERFVVSETRHETTIDDLEDTSFVFDGSIGSLIENAAHLTVALRRTDRGHCASPLSLDLDHFAQRGSL